MKYKKLIDDFKKGVLDRKKVKLIMDNDSGYFRINDDTLSEASIEKLEAKLKKTYGEPGGYEDIVDVLNAAGVPCEGC